MHYLYYMPDARKVLKRRPKLQEFESAGKVTSFRIPQDLSVWLSGYSEDMGLKRSEIIIDALDLYKSHTGLSIFPKPPEPSIKGTGASLL